MVNDEVSAIKPSIAAAILALDDEPFYETTCSWPDEELNSCLRDAVDAGYVVWSKSPYGTERLWLSDKGVKLKSEHKGTLVAAQLVRPVRPAFWCRVL